MYTHKQDRTNREEGLESIVESMYGEDCGDPHGKRKKKKVKEQDDPREFIKGVKRGSSLFKQKEPKDCTHCKGSGDHIVKDKSGTTRSKQKCQVCGGSGKAPVEYHEDTSHYVNKEADNIPPRDDLDAQLNVHGDVDDDHHHNYMVDQDLLQPIHHAANIATDGEAKNFNEWLILQIKDQGDEWVDWFIETVIVKERFRD